ncbi:MAG: RtcB family protein [Solirubrobacterales bacterium]|nr:RtcB family protein [Solirubrobacterales bacterium]
MSELPIERVGERIWEVPAGARAGMRVPARVFADDELLSAIRTDHSLEQLANVATLPGIVQAALAMPDIHQGYGFPVGGVAATEPPAGVVSPGGVGYDINCGVRLLALPLDVGELGARRSPLVREIARRVPVGTGGKGSRDGLRGIRLERVLALGPRALLEDLGIGSEEELTVTESAGCLERADPARLSPRALERGAGQIGTLGSGNHFVELQRVDRLYDPPSARAFGLREGQVTILIHSGSRGLGHQVCTDFVKRMDSRLRDYGIELPDRQLSCAPLDSPEAQAYLGAMAAAANFAWANRAALAERARAAVGAVLGPAAARGLRQVYDVAHNVAKLEQHDGRTLCVHRKGATRAFPPGHPELPGAYQDAGQPVFIPGSMGTASFVLAGRPRALELSFGTTCHGAGRRLSRTAVRKQVRGEVLRDRLEEQGIAVQAGSARGLAEEAPEAYKDVERVVDVVHAAGLAAKVARLRPIGVIKG